MSARARDGERDWIAFAIHIALIGVHLVEEDVTRRHRPQTNGRIGTGQDELPASEFLGEHRVPAIARARRQDQRPKFRAFVDQRLNALL